MGFTQEMARSQVNSKGEGENISFLVMQIEFGGDLLLLQNFLGTPIADL